MPQPKQAQVPFPEPTQEEFLQIVAAADAGGASALFQLREILDHYPSFWQKVADLAGKVEESLIKLISTKSSLLQESLRLKVREMKGNLQGDSPSPLETGVIERIVACWLQVQFAEVASVEHAEDDKAAYWQKRLDQAQRRYMSAVNTLVTIRKLAREPS